MRALTMRDLQADAWTLLRLLPMLGPAAAYCDDPLTNYGFNSDGSEGSPTPEASLVRELSTLCVALDSQQAQAHRCTRLPQGSRGAKWASCLRADSAAHTQARARSRGAILRLSALTAPAGLPLDQRLRHRGLQQQVRRKSAARLLGGHRRRRRRVRVRRLLAHLPGHRDSC
jgi:hypothetical protein